MSHTFHHRGGTDRSHILVTQLENNATRASRLARNTSWREEVKIILFSGWTGSCCDQDSVWGRRNLKKVEHLCSRLQLPRMHLLSYQVGGCSRCNTWSLLSLLWQRTGLDHWRWWGGLRHRDIRGLLQQIIRFEKYTNTELATNQQVFTTLILTIKTVSRDDHWEEWEIWHYIWQCDSLIPEI